MVRCTGVLVLAFFVLTAYRRFLALLLVAYAMAQV